MRAEPVSVVIRALNESGPLRRLLQELGKQDYPGDTEIIVVDNASSDDTVTTARDANAKVVSLRREHFSYPRSMNLGVAAASNELVVLTVAHAWPVNNDWLSKGVRHFRDPQVAGVYSPVLAYPDASEVEKKFYQAGYDQALATGPRRVRPGDRGVFGATNCMLRKSLWQEHPFNEAYGAGGEDGEWAEWATGRGLPIICDAGFVVYHSHGNVTEEDLRRQIEYWDSLGKPAPFDRSRISGHRKDLRFD